MIEKARANELARNNLVRWALRGAMMDKSIMKELGETEDARADSVGKIRNELQKLSELCTEGLIKTGSIGKVKGYLSCPHCASELEKGLGYLRQGSDLKAKYRVFCICGWTSKLFDSEEELKSWYNMRNGIKHHDVEITVRHERVGIEGYDK